jgi:hypothetical protein
VPAFSFVPAVASLLFSVVMVLIFELLLATQFGMAFLLCKTSPLILASLL